MSRRTLRRSRLAAAAALSLAGTIAAGAFVPAQADCVRASAYVYKNKQGRQYVLDRHCIANLPGWTQTIETGAGKESDVYELPAGLPTGAGVRVWLPGPPVLTP